MEQPAWAWAILGMILLTLELLSTSFYFIWFGIAALCVAGLLFLFPPLPLAAQLLCFTVLSVASLLLWRRHFKDNEPELRIGQSQDDTIGKVGHLTAAVSPEQNGTIAFTVPVMGSREWAVISDESLVPGEQAEVVAVVGNFLRVRRKSVSAQPPGFLE